MLSARWKKILLTTGILAIVYQLFASSSEDDEIESMTSLFLDSIAKTFNAINTAQSQSIAQIIQSFWIYGDRDYRKLAYILATAYHESKFLLVKEKRGAPGSDLYIKQEKYWNTGYYGRGFVQLTYKQNYEKMGKILKIDLVGNPDLALDRRYAADIIVIGMMQGIFTGLSLSRYITMQSDDFYNARKVVNDVDKADLIEDYTRSVIKNLRYQIA